MKRSTFRKSSLISSVALLLVAIVALSGATFAWFSANNVANATGLQMKASSASGLFIKVADTYGETTTKNEGWSNDITLTAGTGQFVPTTCAFQTLPNAATSFFKTTVKTEDGTYDASAAIEEAIKGKDFFAEQIWVKTGTTSSMDVKLEVTFTTASKGYERCAIVDGEGNIVCMLASSATDSADAFSDKNATEKTVDCSAFTNGTVVATGDLSAGTCFYVYCWFEGQDTDCKNINSAADLGLSLKFTASETVVAG